MPSVRVPRASSSKRPRDANTNLHGSPEAAKSNDALPEPSPSSRSNRGSQQLDPAESSEPAPKRSKSGRALWWRSLAIEAREHRDDTIAKVLSKTFVHVGKMPVNPPKNVTSIPAEILSDDHDKNHIPNLAPRPRDKNDPIDTTVIPLHYITDITPQSLHRRLMEREWSATAVTLAFLHTAAIAQGLVNCITELMMNRAVTRVHWLDNYYHEHGKPVGPLHGFPISVNDHFEFKDLKGCRDGYVCNWDHFAAKDDRILKALYDAGAVFHCRTTSPQTMMHLETESNLYGVTKNPYNTTLTAGGPCGGEGALVALGGSPLGIGSDFGGGIRCPAANCGNYGFKPTATRIPPHECRHVHDEDDNCMLGIMSTHHFGIRLLMKTIIDSLPWPEHASDNRNPQPEVTPWRDIPDLSTVLRNPGKLRIGVLWHDGIITPHPPITRALRMLTEELKRKTAELQKRPNFHGPSIEIIDFPPYKHDEAWAIIASLYFSGARTTINDSLDKSGEPKLPITKRLLRHHSKFTNLNLSAKQRNTLTVKREAYKASYAAHWDAHAIDILLCPATPGMAPPHGKARYWGYTAQWNCLDYPALVFPVTQVDKDVDIWPAADAERAMQPIAQDNRRNLAAYDREEMHGMPVGLQLVGRSGEDEKVLRVMEWFTERSGLGLWMPTAGF
ncbi:amidase signature enzyme [Lophiostoma macrostomum CBS 122681]|uniref:Amidase signature enzyme n=1 Tax=Lophiostoma macrostomum CBS 122681 TaxID=1314788 RepID=A0A6A6SUX9_9PLEO|nr:amidase signature enzyme [Lophiostoma macrostomum CBS 122681]